MIVVYQCAADTVLGQNFQGIPLRFDFLVEDDPFLSNLTVYALLAYFTA